MRLPSTNRGIFVDETGFNFYLCRQTSPFINMKIKAIIGALAALSLFAACTAEQASTPSWTSYS